MHDGSAVREGVRRGLRSAQPLLDEHARAGLPEGTVHHRRLDRREGFLRGVADGHTLAGGEAVGLDDVLAAEAPHVVHRRLRVVEGGGVAGRDAGVGHQLLGERLRELDLRRRARGPEDRDALGAQCVGDPGGERRLRPDDHEVRAQPCRRRDDGGPVVLIEIGEVLAVLGGARVARRAREAAEARRLGELPGDRVLAPAAAEQEDVRAHRASCLGVAAVTPPTPTRSCRGASR